MARYEVVRDEEGYYVIDLKAPIVSRIIARFYGDGSFKNAEAFCFMKNMWQTSG